MQRYQLPLRATMVGNFSILPANICNYSAFCTTQKPDGLIGFRVLSAAHLATARPKPDNAHPH